MKKQNLDEAEEQERKQRKAAEKEEQKLFLKAQGKHLAELRKSKGYNQFDFASAVNLVINSVSKIERGIADTRIFTLYKMSKVLNVPLAQLVDFKDYSNMESPNDMVIKSIVEILKGLDEERLLIIKKQIEAFRS